MSDHPMRRFVLSLLGVMLLPQTGWSQGLELKRATPAVEWSGCPDGAALPPAETGSSEREEAERLAAAAAQAAIVGDNETALTQLTRAAALDPNAAFLAYRRARALETLARVNEAVQEYCRYLTLPGGDDDTEVRERLAALTRPAAGAVPRRAADAWTAAIADFDAGRFGAAEEGFTAAATAAPRWGDPLFNRAITHLSVGQTDDAVSDFRRYLELAPGAPDFEVVLDYLSSLRTGPRYSPATVFATGLLVPGLGHFTTDRPVAGGLLLAAAGAAVASGVLIERVKVECLSDPVNGRCPPDQVLREKVERPYLTAAIAAAAAIGIGGAIDAMRGANDRNRAESEPRRVGDPRDATLRAPGVRFDGHQTRLDLLRLRF